MTVHGRNILHVVKLELPTSLVRRRFVPPHGAVSCYDPNLLWIGRKHRTHEVGPHIQDSSPIGSSAQGVPNIERSSASV